MKITRKARLVMLIVTGALLGSGCTTVQKDARFDEIRDSVSIRTGETIDWREGGDSFARVRVATTKAIESELTTESAIQLALLNNRRLQASIQNLGIAQADLVEAGLLENPVLSAGALFRDAGTEIDLDVMQGFLGVFTLSARKKLGMLEAERTTLMIASDVIELTFKVKEQYYRVLAHREALGLAEQVRMGAEAAAEIALRQYAAGNLSKRDQNLQQSFYAESVVEVARAEVQFATERERLTRLMGLWGSDAQWKIPARLPRPPELLPDLQRIESLAVSNRLDLAVAKKEVATFNGNLTLARQTRWLGPLGIGVQFSREAAGEKSYGPRVELGLPFFDRGQVRIARLESQRKRAEELLAALAVDIRSEAREARAHVIAARDIALHYEKALLPLQKTNVSEMLKFYNGMLVGVYELLIASREQIRTSRQYIEASRDFWIALVELERTVGHVIPLSRQVESSQGDPGNGGVPKPEEESQNHGEHKS